LESIGSSPVFYTKIIDGVTHTERWCGLSSENSEQVRNAIELLGALSRTAVRAADSLELIADSLRVPFRLVRLARRVIFGS
jgi:hypothetical protein